MQFRICLFIGFLCNPMIIPFTYSGIIPNISSIPYFEDILDIFYTFLFIDHTWNVPSFPAPIKYFPNTWGTNPMFIYLISLNISLITFIFHIFRIFPFPDISFISLLSFSFILWDTLFRVFLYSRAGPPPWCRNAWYN